MPESTASPRSTVQVKAKARVDETIILKKLLEVESKYDRLEKRVAALEKELAPTSKQNKQR